MSNAFFNQLQSIKFIKVLMKCQKKLAQRDFQIFAKNAVQFCDIFDNKCEMQKTKYKSQIAISFILWLPNSNKQTTK